MSTSLFCASGASIKKEQIDPQESPLGKNEDFVVCTEVQKSSQMMSLQVFWTMDRQVLVKAALILPRLLKG